MRQVKLFKALECEWEKLEQEINDWIAETGANVVNISGNIAPQSQRSHPNARENPSDVLVIVTFEPALVSAS
jgi:hypothetical protein